MPIDKAPELYGPLDGLKMLLKMLPFLSTIRKWDSMSMQDFAARFKSPFLKEVFPLIWLPEFSMFPLMDSWPGFTGKGRGILWVARWSSHGRSKGDTWIWAARLGTNQRWSR